MYELFNGTTVTLERGAEHNLLVCLLEEEWDSTILNPEYEEGECSEWTRVPLLNRLEDYKQQGYLYYLVGRALLEEEFVLTKTAWSDGALYHLLCQATLHRWDDTIGRILVAIVAKNHKEKAALLKGIDEHRWFRLHFLERRYLDRYFAGETPFLNEDSVMDTEPSKSAAIKKVMGVRENYFTALPPYPTESDMEKAMEWMAGIADEARVIQPSLWDSSI